MFFNSIRHTVSAFFPKAGDFGSSYSFIKVVSMNLTMEGVLIFFLTNPVVVVSSSIFYLFRGFLHCFVSLTVLLQRTFGDFGMDGFLLFDFSFGDFEGGAS